MNVAEVRDKMRAVVVALEERRTDEESDDGFSQAVERGRQQIERIRKAFKHQIDERAQQKVGFRGYRGFSINEREGIERKLAEACEEAINEINAIARHVDG